jgi:hypothetical protein
MSDASYDWRAALASRVPVGHTLQGDPVPPYVYPGRGSGGLLATLDDVARFVQAGMAPPFRPEPRVLSDSTVALLHTPVARPGGLFGLVADGYALGHFVETLSDGRRSVWHGGQGYGWMTHAQWVPETGNGVILLANSQRAWPLFGHILRRWSASMGVEPVGMSRVTLARPLAWMLVFLLLAGAGLQTLRLQIGYSRGRRRWMPRTRTHPVVGLLQALAGVALLGLVAWAATRDYLFIFSILPGMMGWLGGSLAAAGAVLLASALVPATAGGRPPSPPPLPGSVAALLAFLTLTGRPVEAQQSLAEFEATFYPTSQVARVSGNPATEARVEAFRASVFLPLVLGGDRTTFVPRLVASRVAIAPAPLDPTQPVWVEGLYDVDVEFLLLHTLSPQWGLTVVAAPGLATDGRNVSLEHGTAQGAALLTRSLGENRSWGFGASVTNSFGQVQALPVLAFQTRGERVRVDLLAPAQASAFLQAGTRLDVGIRARVDGNVYTLGRQGTLNGGRVRYSVVDEGPAARLRLTDALRLSLEAGISVGRRLEVEDAAGLQVEDATLRTGTHLRIGLQWVSAGRR